MSCMSVMSVQICSAVFCLQQQRRQLTDCALQWGELQEVFLGEESDLHDNRILLDERNRRTDRRQVKLTWKCRDFYIMNSTFLIVEFCVPVF